MWNFKFYLLIIFANQYANLLKYTETLILFFMATYFYTFPE